MNRLLFTIGIVILVGVALLLLFSNKNLKKNTTWVFKFMLILIVVVAVFVFAFFYNRDIILSVGRTNLSPEAMNENNNVNAQINEQTTITVSLNQIIYNDEIFDNIYTDEAKNSLLEIGKKQGVIYIVDDYALNNTVDELIKYLTDNLKVDSTHIIIIEK